MQLKTVIFSSFLLHVPPKLNVRVNPFVSHTGIFPGFRDGIPEQSYRSFSEVEPIPRADQNTFESVFVVGREGYYG
jgi:hypothetical protein